MTSTTTKPDSSQPAVEMAVDLLTPVQSDRERVRAGLEFIEEMIAASSTMRAAQAPRRRRQPAGSRGPTFPRLPPSQLARARTTHVINKSLFRPFIRH